MVSPSEVAAEVLALAMARPPTLGAGRLISIDGPAGSGKTTVAAAVAELDSDAQVVHMDDLYPGWDGLPRVGAQLETLLRPLAAGSPGSYRRYDWHASAYAETVAIPPAPLLVLEGVGAGLASYDALRTVLVWLTAPEALRRARWLAREGSGHRLEAWRHDEDVHFADDRTADRADLVATT